MRIDQQRAKCAAICIAAIEQRGDKLLANYAALARGLPAMLMTVGLGQTIAFLDSKAKPGSEHDFLAQHLRTWLTDSAAPIAWTFTGSNTAKKFRDFLVEFDDTAVYYQALGEAIGIAGWLKRFATAAVNEHEPSLQTGTAGGHASG